MTRNLKLGNESVRFWDQVAGKYDEEIFNTLKADRRGTLPSVIKQYAAKASLAADFGCGVGRFLPLLSDLAKRVVAVDFSPDSVDLARDVSCGLKNVSLDCVDLAKTRSPICSADIGLSINVMVMPDESVRRAILETTHRSLRSGGHLIAVVPSLESAVYSYQRLVEWYEREGDSYQESAEFVEKDARREIKSLIQGHLQIQGTTTKHYLREECLLFFDRVGFEPVQESRIEYEWSEDYETPPSWMRDPYPWDWLFVFKRS